MLAFFAAGTAAPQGSKDYLGRNPRTGKMRAKESSPNLKAWRRAVRQAAEDASTAVAWPTVPAGVPTCVRLVFVRQRYAGTPRRIWGRLWWSRMPDIDKLSRAVLDALKQAGVYADDGQVSRLTADKYVGAPGEVPGCYVTVTVLPDLVEDNPFASS